MSVDTLSLAKELRAAELPPEQAEAIAAAIGRAVLEGAATKADIVAVRTDLAADIKAARSDISQFRAELEGKVNTLEGKIDTKIEQLRSQMMIWFIATNLTIGAIIIAALKL